MHVRYLVTLILFFIILALARGFVVSYHDISFTIPFAYAEDGGGGGGGEGDGGIGFGGDFGGIIVSGGDITGNISGDEGGGVVGDGGTILKTTNGGTLWFANNSGTSNKLLSVFFYRYKYWLCCWL